LLFTGKVARDGFLGIPSYQVCRFRVSTFFGLGQIFAKNAGETSIVLCIMAREQRIPTSRNPTQNKAVLWQIFLSNKSRQPIERQDSMQTLIPTSRRLDSFLNEAAQNFEVFSNIQG
jgi:hypothetical protein